VTRVRFVVGIDPDLQAIEAAGWDVLEQFEGAIAAALVRVPRGEWSLYQYFGGVLHAYDTEAAARQVWSLFNR
jgi:hypothetical protein